MFKKLANIGLLFVGFFLIVTFIISAIVGYANKSSVSEELLLKYAQKFLNEKQYIYLGKNLDCSGFTKNVYMQYKIHLPASAAEQYKFCKTNLTTIKTADLVFFNINNTAIDHVGMLVNDSLFIHSPGIGRAVKLDNLNDSYWDNHLFGYGRVLKSYK